MSEKKLREKPIKNSFFTEYKCGFRTCGAWSTQLEEHRKFCESEAGKYILQLESKLTQPQQTVSDEEIDKEAWQRYGEVTGGQYHADRPHERKVFSKGAQWMQDKLQPQTNEGEFTLEEVVENLENNINELKKLISC